MKNNPAVAALLGVSFVCGLRSTNRGDRPAVLFHADEVIE